MLIGWLAITVYVEQKGPSKQWSLGSSTGKKALIVYDPDPFYNLDEQVCLSFGKALAEQNMNVTVVTVAATDSIKTNSYHVLVYCANTYNWRPDWSITSYIEERRALTAPIVAITLGAGSTATSQRKFEQIITNAGGKILESYSLWLWRPNDSQKMDEPNVDVAVAMAYNWGKQIAGKIN